MRQPRGIQRVLQTICSKQNKHYASQLPVERERRRDRREHSLWGRGQWRANGVTAPRNVGERFSATGKASIKNTTKQMGNKHLQLRQRRRNMRRNSCAITFILFRRLLLPKCVSTCWGQGATLAPAQHPHLPPTTSHFPLEELCMCVCVCVDGAITCVRNTFFRNFPLCIACFWFVFV